MTELFIPPQWFLLVCAAAWRLLPQFVRRTLVLIIPTFVLSQVWLIPLDTTVSITTLVGEMQPYTNSELNRLFATIFSFALGGVLLYGWTIATKAEQTWTLFYASAAYGIVYAGDLISLFIAWELLAIGALGVIWSKKTEESEAAGLRYFLVHVLGGVLFMMGLTAHLAANTAGIGLDTISPEALQMKPMLMSEWYHWCMLAGIGINAAIPPLWSWVPDAYPTASSNGTVVLACFTTKSAVLVLIKLFPGVDLLIPLGLAMIIYGGIYAALEGNIRRSLAYSLIGQVGFMVVCVGIGTQLALLAAAVHAFSHIVYKTLLLMTAGCIVRTTGKQNMYEVGGMAKRMPDIAACAVVGSFALAAAPFTSGFISKSLIIEAVLQEKMLGTWLIMMLAAGAAMVYVGMRYLWFCFFQGEPPPAERRLSLSMRLGVYAFTALCLATGLFPGWLNIAMSDMAVVAPDFHPYSAGHVLYQVQILAASVLVFCLSWKWLTPKPGALRDFDISYLQIGPAAFSVSKRCWNKGASAVKPLVVVADHAKQRINAPHKPEGLMARTWATGTMALWVALMLNAFLWLYLF